MAGPGIPAAEATPVSLTTKQRLQAARRQARKRIRDAARAQVRAEAAARRLEAAQRAAEELAPLAQRTGLEDTTGLLRAPRLVVLEGKAVRSRHPDLTRPQRRAADRLRSDWEEVASGVATGVARLEGVASGFSGSAAPDAGVIAQLVVRARLEGAVTWMGALAPIVLRVICGRAPLAAWSRETGQTTEEAGACLRVGLDRLVKYYDSGEKQKSVKPDIVSFGPGREEYET